VADENDVNPRRPGGAVAFLKIPPFTVHTVKVVTLAGVTTRYVVVDMSTDPPTIGRDYPTKREAQRAARELTRDRRR
jgi:hypothetical protein